MGLTLKLFLTLSFINILTLGFSETIMCEGTHTVIPPITHNVHALHLRNVGANRIYALDFPNTLIDLNLSNNNLMLLPHAFIPKNIKRLWLADNRLLELPKDASNWTQLIYLNLDRNLFATLPDLSKTSLRWLRVNHNQLTTLPPLPDSIERLYLAQNKLTSYSHNPKALRHLDLSDNPIEAIPDTLGCGLESLNLSGTRIRHLPQDLTAWRTLRILNLSRCPIDETERARISAAFHPLSTLVLF